MSPKFHQRKFRKLKLNSKKKFIKNTKVGYLLENLTAEQNFLTGELTKLYENLSDITEEDSRKNGLTEVLHRKRDFLQEIAEKIQQLRKFVRRAFFKLTNFNRCDQELFKAEKLRVEINTAKIALRAWLKDQQNITCPVRHCRNESCIICLDFLSNWV